MPGTDQKNDDAPPACCPACLQEFSSDTSVCPFDGTVLVSKRPEHSMAGKVFVDRYEIIRTIGEGGMGKVYKARHILMKRLAAIKVVHPHLVSSAATLNRFQREAEAVSCLNHPNIVAVHDFGLAPNAYLVMDFLDGITLADLVKIEPLGLERSLRIFVQICAGLEHAHKSGIIHRDLKPCNIMLVNLDGAADVVKIVDFGIAKLVLRDVSESNHLTATGEVFGSPLYMSPEQCRAKSVDARSDIYSLGCIMYRTLTGCQPIVGSEMMECLYNHVNSTPISFAEIAPQLRLPNTVERVVMKCLEKSPENRFQSMLELRDHLEVLLLQSFSVATDDAVEGTLPRVEEVAKTGIDSKRPYDSKGNTPPELVRANSAAEAGRIASAAEASRAAWAAEAGFAAEAAEGSLVAAAAEAIHAARAVENGLAATALESERAAAAAECARAASAAEATRAASAAEAGRAATAAEAGRAASAKEASMVAFAAEISRASAAAEAAKKANTGDQSDQINVAISSEELGLSASAAEASRAALAVESTRVAFATEAGLAASANEAAFAACARESALAASALEAGFAASAAESRRAASAAEFSRAASAKEFSRAANAAEVNRAANAAEVNRAASAAEAGRVASAAEAERAAAAREIFENRDSEAPSTDPALSDSP